ncbi:MAG: insulinase family protein [Rhodospirillales bacterium]|nr:insulinase family protein [Rhodospirillales bacterium]
MTFISKTLVALSLVGVLFVGGAAFLPTAAQAVTIDKVVSPGGIEAWLVRDHTNPIISLRFAFRGGAALEANGKEGLANFVASTMDEGAGDLDSQAFQGKLEDLVISLRFDAGRDSFGGRLKTLVENKAVAFDLLKLALTAPRFDAESVERIRSQILSGLRRETEQPGAIASKTLMKTLFPNHPYGRPANGTLESVPKLTRADLRDFVGRRLAKDNLIIGVVGDIGREELSKVLDATFGGLPAKAAPWDIPDATPQGAGRTIVIEKQVPQSTITFAEQGLKRKNPDFYAAYVMNHVFGGGGFTSRLYNTIREERGLVYSVYSGLHPLKNAGLIVGGAGTANKRVSETLEVLRREWKRMAESGMSKAELKDAKTYLTGSYPLRFTSSDTIASMLVGIQMDGLGIDYMDRRNAIIEGVTLEDVNRVAKTYLLEDRLTVVVVGKPNGVKGTN